jgi:threonine/homoserine/homoserine lactone efflux protein
VVAVDQVLGLLLASALLIVVPGPTVLFVVGRALAHGRRVAAVARRSGCWASPSQGARR